MSRLALRFSLLAGLCVFAAPVSAKVADKHAMALEQELQLAASEGLPTTVVQYKKYLPSEITGANAATFYKQLTSLRTDWRFPPTLLIDSIYKPQTLPKARDYLKGRQRELGLIDQASMLPCRFERDWTLGAAEPYIELPDVYHSVDLLLLRANVAAAEGRFSDATKSCKQAEQIGLQVRSEPNLMSQVVANTMLYAVWRNLADLAFHYRGKRVFAPELVRSMSAVTPPDLKTMHRFSLVEILSTVELFQTAEGRAKAGLPAHDDADTIEENAAATLLSKHLSETQAKLIIVRESRALWKEICSPGPASARRNQLTRQRMRVGLAKFPYALGICESLLLLQQDPYGVIQQDQARRLLFRGVSRALAAPSIPKKLDIKDIRSPIDNSPMQYTFDGSRLTVAIRLSRFRKDGMFSLTFPPKPKRASK